MKMENLTESRYSETIAKTLIAPESVESISIAGYQKPILHSHSVLGVQGTTVARRLCFPRPVLQRQQPHRFVRIDRFCLAFSRQR